MLLFLIYLYLIYRRLYDQFPYFSFIIFPFNLFLRLTFRDIPRTRHFGQIRDTNADLEDINLKLIKLISI